MSIPSIGSAPSSGSGARVQDRYAATRADVPSEAEPSAGMVSTRAGDAPATRVTLSAEAKALLSAKAVSARDFATITSDARAALDAGYKRLGTPVTIHTTGNEWDQVFGDMDRRSLFAVASNSEGLFSKREQEVAQYIMARQQSDAMKAANPLGNNKSGMWKATVHFLDGVSEEEKKGSLDWAVQRASAQWAYENNSREEGAQPENLDSGDPLVNMLKKAMEGLKGGPARMVATGEIVKDLRDMPLFKDGYFAKELSEALEARVKK